MEEDATNNDSVQEDGQDEAGIRLSFNEEDLCNENDLETSVKSPSGKPVRGRGRSRGKKRGARSGGGTRARARRKTATPEEPSSLFLQDEEEDQEEEGMDQSLSLLESSENNNKNEPSIAEDESENKENGKLNRLESVEEPDDSSIINHEEFDEDGQLLGFKDADDRRLTAFNVSQENMLLPEKSDGTKGKDSGSEGDSENEDKIIEDRDIGRKRGRGRSATQWKRGRRRKSPAAARLPMEATSGLPEYLQEELQHAFEIYTALKSIPKVGPFLDKPSSSMFGMSTYYNEVTSPMWLNEVKRKLLCHGYKCISEFVLDIRLMLENCYKFWGTEHKFSRIALQLEAKMEQKLDSLPPPLKEKCKDSAIEGCDGEILNMDIDDFRSFSEESNDTSKSKYKTFSSKIVNRLSENSKPTNSLVHIDAEKEEKILSWERSHLGSAEIKNNISSMWELAAIGVFLHIAHALLNIKVMRQYEIERMFLIPKESTTLATIMTSMLSPAANRSKLDATVPIMSYEVWNKRLQKKVDDWFNSYHNKKRNESEVFLSCGIEPHFWHTLSSLNPYENTDDFSEMSFQERCLIFKALCDNLCHTTKSIQELFMNDETALSLDYSKDALLGELDNYTYFFLPFWPDIRVYRTRAISNKVRNSSTSISVLTNKLLEIIVTSDSHHGSNNASSSKLFMDFTLVAESNEDLLALMEQFKGLNQNMSSKLKKFNMKVKKQYMSHLPVLSIIWDQWNGCSDRVTSNAESIKYWEINEDPIASKYFDVEDPVVLGKRQRKINMSTPNILSSDEEDEDIFDEVPELEDDGSDWECPSEKKKSAKKPLKLMDADSNPSEPKTKKKRGPKGPRGSKGKSGQIENMPAVRSPPLDSVSSVVIRNVQSLSGDIKSQNDLNSMSANPQSAALNIKTEAKSFKVELDDSDMETQSTTESEGVKQEIKNEIKEESKEDNSAVISLSSNDEEDDDDVIITTPIKQQLPPATTPVRTPAPTAVRPPAVPMSPSTPRQTNPSAIIRSPGMPSPRLASPATPQHSPRMQFTTSPRLVSPQQGSPRIVTPRQMSPMRPGFPSPGARFSASPMQQMGPSPRQRGASPRGFTPAQPHPAQPPQVSRNLFNNARPPQPNNPKSMTAKLVFGKRDDGSYGYLARLPDGGVINMSPTQINNIKKRHGTIPPMINIPLDKR